MAHRLLQPLTDSVLRFQPHPKTNSASRKWIAYARLPRREFSARPPLTFSLRARASSESIPGTWGFGLWNDPFGLSLGFGGNPFSLPALPNAIWFFHASPKNYLSFREDKPAQGFTCSNISAVRAFIHSLLTAGLALPFST